ncbi:MAG: hypothetical protein H6741_34775 [Alphaproteobacteria bacterium]|nr:hypothetical protein [Alphaproteobacteria bacterium]
MNIRFVKTPGAKDRAYVERPDGSAAHWSFPSYGPRALPHDLVHFVVEAELGLARGLWGLIAEGVDIARVNQAADRAGGRVADKYGALGELSDILVAELFAGQPWSADWADDAQLLEALVQGCAELGVPAPELERVRALRAAVAALRARWVGLGEKGTLVLSWPPSEFIGQTTNKPLNT